MTQIKAAATSIINASPQKVYAILANYRDAHSKILPEHYFSDYNVERGGIGAGTIVQFQTHVAGKSRTVHAEVSEPEPGRILAETDLETGLVTTFTIEPLNGRKKASVTIKTRYRKSGIMGFIERLTAPFLLRRIYAKELQKLENYARNMTDLTSFTEEIPD